MASTPHPTTEAETAHRTVVALHLADAIERAATRTDIADLEAAASRMPDLGWQLAVALARELYPEWHPAADYLPSPKTRVATLAVLRDRGGHPDPFEGFPAS